MSTAAQPAPPKVPSAPVFDAAEFRAAIAQLNKTMNEVCTDAKVDKGNLSNTLAGKRGISPKSCGKLAGQLPGTAFASTWAEYIPATSASARPAQDGPVFYIPLHQLDANPDNNRTEFHGIEELADSILSRGLQTAIAVARTRNGRYRVVAGDRRRLAFIDLKLRREWPAGQPKKDWQVPVTLRTGDRADLMIDTLIENLMRVDIPPLDEAMGFKKLRDMGMTTKDIAAKLGRTDDKGRRLVQQRLQIANGLCDAGRTALKAQTITVEQARALASLPAALQAMLLRRDHATLPKSESSIRNEAVLGYPRIEDMAFGIAAYQAEKGPSLKLGTGTWLLDTALAEKLQGEAAERLKSELEAQGYAAVDIRHGHPGPVVGDETMDPKAARAFVFIKPRTHIKGVGEITVVRGVPLTGSLPPASAAQPPASSPASGPAAALTQDTDNQSDAPGDDAPPELDDIINAASAVIDAQAEADAAFADVLFIRDNPQTHARAENYTDARKVQQDAALALKALLEEVLA